MPHDPYAFQTPLMPRTFGSLRQQCVKVVGVGAHGAFMKPASEAMTAQEKQLKTLCSRVEHWRKHRDGGRARVPEDLWNSAVEVARVAGVHAASKALRFNYYSLKDRLVLADSAAPRQKKADRGATFVEVQLPAPPALPSPTPRVSAAGGQTVVELVGTGGARMRIDVTGTSTVDVVALAQAFWSSEP